MEFRALLGILSEFGRYARYYNFNIITDNPKITTDPKAKWQEFERNIWNKKPQIYNKLLDSDSFGEIAGDISSYLIIILEKFIHSLSLQMSMGFLGNLGSRNIGILSTFIFLDKGKYGKTNYRKNTTKYKEKEVKIWTREDFEQTYSIYKEIRKEKTITKSSFNGEWPFLADKVIIELRGEFYCVIIIDNFVFALNGHTQRKYKLEFPHEAGFAILGKSIGDFIIIAQSL